MNMAEKRPAASGCWITWTAEVHSGQLLINAVTVEVASSTCSSESD